MTQIFTIFDKIQIENQQQNQGQSMFSTSPSWSMHGKRPTSKVSQTPAPTGYHPEKWAQFKAPSWKIGSDSRNKQNREVSPGPGQYNCSEVQRRAKFGKFGHESHTKKYETDVPAPNQYEPNFKVARPSTPSSTIAMKIKENLKTEAPGPGKYEPILCTKEKPKIVKIGLQRRFITEKVDGPGPQAYSPNKDHYKTIFVGFTKESKENSSYCQNYTCKIPGPGTYESNGIFTTSLRQRKGFSLSSKPNKSPEAVTPGPGEYNPLYSTQQKDSKITIAPKYTETKPQTIPGPAEYNVKYLSRTVNSGYTVGRSERGSVNVNILSPGPGAYEPKSIYRQTPKYSLLGSRMESPRNNSPGPGAYNPDKNLIKSRPQSAKMGRSKRGQGQRCTNPGPGAYNLRPRPTTPCIMFTKSPRLVQNRSKSPGPGEYECSQILGQTQQYHKKN